MILYHYTLAYLPESILAGRNILEDCIKTGMQKLVMSGEESCQQL